MSLFRKRTRAPTEVVLFAIQEIDYVSYISREYRDELVKHDQLELLSYRRDFRNRLTFYYRFKFKG